MGLTIADGAVALVVLVSAMLAFNRGLVREALAIGGWVIAAFAAFFFAPMFAPLLLEVPYAGDFLKSSCTLNTVAAFIVVFGIALIVLSIFTPLLSSAVHATPLAPVDKGLGFIFGVARGFLLVSVLFLLYNLAINDSERLAVIEELASHSMISDAADAISANVPTAVPGWMQNRIDGLMSVCTEGEAT